MTTLIFRLQSARGNMAYLADDVTMEVAGLLLQYRLEVGLTQDAAAAKSGVGMKMLSAIETGRRTSRITLPELLALLCTYGQSLAQFERDLLQATARARGMSRKVS